MRPVSFEPQVFYFCWFQCQKTLKCLFKSTALNKRCPTLSVRVFSYSPWSWWHLRRIWPLLLWRAVLQASPKIKDRRSKEHQEKAFFKNTRVTLRSLQINGNGPGIPRNLMNLVFPGAGHLITTHRGWEIWSLASIFMLRRADSTWRDKSWRQALMHSKRKIPDSWRTGWKAKVCTSFALYIFGMYECCLLNHVYIYSFRSIIEATEKFPGVGRYVLQIAGCRLKYTYNWKAAGTKSIDKSS